MYFLNVLLTLCTHIERSSKFPSVSDSWCMRESQQYVSTYAACFIVKLLGGKQLICGPGRRNRENEDIKDSILASLDAV